MANESDHGLEPGCGAIGLDFIERSKAISLKRIADSLEKLQETARTGDLLQMVYEAGRQFDMGMRSRR
jgi:hypothetical protein